MYSDEDYGFNDDSPRKRPQNKNRNKRARDHQQPNVYEDEQEETLYSFVLKNTVAMSELANGWVVRYQNDRDTALLELIQFFFNSSGCKGIVTPDLYRGIGGGFQEVLKKMTDDFQEDGSEYPLTINGQNFRQFKQRLGDFLHQFVSQSAEAELLYDEFMMDYVLQLLIEMSASPVRAFRHTGTLCAMKLMSALVTVALNVNKEIEDTTAQFEMERMKSDGERSQDALDMLNDRKSELENHQQEVEQFLNNIFKDIFIMRYRDYCPEIRVICMDEISVWMRTFPKVFLSDQYLKYVGWLLNDKAKEVRKSCLTALASLVRDKELCTDLALFTKRFRRRLVSMANDVDNECAVMAIRALTNILMNSRELNLELSDQDCESIYTLVFHIHRPIALAAAEFLNRKLFSQSNLNDVSEFTSRGKRRSQNMPHLINLIHFYTDADIHQHTTYLVDALWDVNPNLLRDWECMTQLLLDDDSKLEDREETALVDLLVRTVKQAAVGVPPAGRTGVSSKKATGAREKQKVLEDRQSLTDELIEPLPRLYNKFAADRAKMILLLQIPRYFDLECYTLSRGETHLHDLLVQLTETVEKHVSDEILSEVAETFAYLANPDANICTKVHSEVILLVDKLEQQFTNGVEFFIAQSDRFTAAETARIGNLARRLAILAAQNDLTHKEISTRAIDLLRKRENDEIQLDNGLIAALIRLIYTDLIWWKMKLVEATSDEIVHETERVKDIAVNLVKQCAICLRIDNKEVKEAAFEAACDGLVAFGPQIAHNVGFERLITTPTQDLIQAMQEYLAEYIFKPAIGGSLPVGNQRHTTEALPKLADLNKRRRYLAAFCKLFAYRMIELKHGADVFMHYLKCYADYGDIIKEAISKSRNLDQVTSAHTLVLSLRKQYLRLLHEGGGSLDKSSPEFTQLKELARRFALTFGLDTFRTREAVTNLHKGGIEFALQIMEGDDKPRYLSFLEVLTEFSTKLIKQDKHVLLQVLESKLPEGRQPHTQDEYWIPYMTYRNTLQQIGPKGSSMPTRSAQNQFTPNMRNMPQKSPQYTRSRNPSVSSNGSTTFNHQMDVSEAGPMESTRIPGNRFNITNMSQNTPETRPPETPESVDATPMQSRSGRNPSASTSRTATPASSVTSSRSVRSKKSITEMMGGVEDLYDRNIKGTQNVKGSRRAKPSRTSLQSLVEEDELSETDNAPVESTKIGQPMEMSGDEFQDTQRSVPESDIQSQKPHPSDASASRTATPASSATSHRSVRSRKNVTEMMGTRIDPDLYDRNIRGTRNVKGSRRAAQMRSMQSLMEDDELSETDNAPVESTKIGQPMEMSGDEFQNTQRSESESDVQSQKAHPPSRNIDPGSDTPQEPTAKITCDRNFESF